METCIRLRGVIKEFGSGDELTRAVDDIDLDIGVGEIVALLGPNGAGKTSTLDMILGFEPSTQGTVEVFGQAPGDAVADGRVSAVLQTGGLIRDLTVGETVELVASTYPDPPEVEDVIARAGLTELVDRKVQASSGGEQQRLRFALALLAEPDLLILDEPTAGMDVQARQDFWTAMRAEAGLGRTVVFATHYLQEAEDFADRTVLIANGRIVADGPTETLRREASGRRVKAHFSPTTIGHAAQELASLAETKVTSLDDEWLLIATPDSDTVARMILGDLGGTDVEIAAASLEDAFIQLTQTDTALPLGVLQ